MPEKTMRERLERRDPFLSAQLVVLAAILLGLLLPSGLTLGPPWLFPAIEGVLLVGLVLTTPPPSVRTERVRRYARVGLVGLVSAVNVLSLILLAQSLAEGNNVSGRALLQGGVILWLTAVLLFAVWFWELDRGGMLRRQRHCEHEPDFLFPPMRETHRGAKEWQPQLLDYLYLSLTNAAAFSPSETLPLTSRAKLLMSAQTLGSLATMMITLSYAVGNLG